MATRIGFRFAVVYFGLFCLIYAQITFVFTGLLWNLLPDSGVLWQMIALEPLTRRVGRTVFGIDAALNPMSGSGDQAAIWVLMFCLFVIAVVATIGWSVLDRRRTAYPRLAAWFTVFLRLCLGGQMLFYGFAKLIPTQMPSPPLAALLEPFGNLSPAGVLWLQVGTSLPYQIALGSVEVLAGLLLFVPATATAGALVSVVATAQIFLLNMTFDVPVKILSSHLLLISLLLVAPHARRLGAAVLGRATGEERRRPLLSSPRADRVAAVVQVALGLWVAAGCLLLSVQLWQQSGGGRPKPELYGIWSTTEFISDEKRWQRLVFDTPGILTYQLTDGELVDVPASHIDDTLVLSDQSGEPMARFTIVRDGADRLRLTGELEGRPATIVLQRVPLDEFTLHSRGFRWVQEEPFFG
ncbi:DoxX family protein [Mycobacterium sp. SMC-4]|nr:DoxX family protein [Mycobacterium sp. SMC-4]